MCYLKKHFFRVIQDALSQYQEKERNDMTKLREEFQQKVEECRELKMQLVVGGWFCVKYSCVTLNVFENFPPVALNLAVNVDFMNFLVVRWI